MIHHESFGGEIIFGDKNLPHLIVVFEFPFASSRF